MRISYGSIILAGGSATNEEPYDLQLLGDHALSTESLVGEDFLRVTDDLATYWKLIFGVYRQHASAAAAAQYVLAHGIATSALAAADTVVEVESNGVVVQAYRIRYSALELVEAKLTGQTTWHRYTIAGGEAVAM